jgi:PPOX class probable F420-dependent enzyme
MPGGASGYPRTMPTGPLPEKLVELLRKPNPAVIATLEPDGAPNTVATWYLWEDGRVLVNMDEGRARLDHLRRDPRVSLTVLDGDSWYRHVSLRGRIDELVGDEDLADIDRLSQHYTRTPYASRDRGRVSGWIAIESWHAWDGGKPMEV